MAAINPASRPSALLPTAPTSGTPPNRPRRAHTPRTAADPDIDARLTSESPSANKSADDERGSTKAFLNAVPAISSDSLDPETLWETHVMAPAPSQTYWQLMVLGNETVVLRDWPRKRFSTKWTRDGAINPSEKKIKWEELGEWEERIKSVFGEEVWTRVALLCGFGKNVAAP